MILSDKPSDPSDKKDKIEVTAYNFAKLSSPPFGYDHAEWYRNGVRETSDDPIGDIELQEFRGIPNDVREVIVAHVSRNMFSTEFNHSTSRNREAIKKILAEMAAESAIHQVLADARRAIKNLLGEGEVLPSRLFCLYVVDAIDALIGDRS